MGTLRWKGGASAVAQEDRFTPANVEINDIFTLTATAEDGVTTVAINFTATAGTVANVTAGLTAAWNASTNVLCTGVTASDQTTYVKLLADVAGVPFYVAATTTDGGGTNNQTLTRTATTANVGPNDYNTAANWSTGAIPVNGDDVYVDEYGAGYAILYGLNQSTVTLNSYNQSMAYTGSNALIGDGTYYLRLSSGASKIHTIGYQSGGTSSQAGSKRTMIDFGTVATTINVLGTSTTSQTGEEMKQPLRLKCNSASTVLNVFKGYVALAADRPGETSTIGTVSVAYTSSQASDVSMVIGSGVTVTTVTKTGGDVQCNCAPTTFTSNAGTATINSTGTITNLNHRGGTTTTLGSFAVTNFSVYGGTLYSNSSGTITTGALEGGTLDFSRSNRARTVTSLQTTLHGIYGPSTLVIDDSIVTLTGKYEPVGRCVLTTAA